MCGPTLPLTPTKTHDPISVDLREKRIFFSFLSLSLSPLTVFNSSSFFFLIRLYLFSFSFLSFLFFFLFFLNFGHMDHIAPCVHHSFGSISTQKKNYLFSIQFILTELSSSHFLTSEIFVKISFLESLAVITQKIVKIFRLYQNSTKLFWVTRFRETNLTM